jgi:GSCFA family
MSTLKLKLTLDAKPAAVKINYGEKIMLIGSCFTENIGAKLHQHLFESLENPHGILFNPISVQNALEDYISNKKYTEADLFYLNEIWNSWHHHSRFSGINPKDALDKINNAINEAHHFLQSANHLVITLGSAWLYTLNEQAPSQNGLVVANNHKAPSNWFSKKIMQPLVLVENLKSIIDKLKIFNPHLHIIFTISPVRHLREGLVENNRSKAVLIHAIHELISAKTNVDYFPAYEYVVDDLRDYRFYAEDLVHPNFAASNYVWDKLTETYMDAATQNIMKQVAELQLAMHHKPFFSGSTEHQKFLNACIEKTKLLMAVHPYLALQKHLQFFNEQIGK